MQHTITASADDGKLAVRLREFYRPALHL